jgi:hypothetical protein
LIKAPRIEEGEHGIHEDISERTVEISELLEVGDKERGGIKDDSLSC